MPDVKIEKQATLDLLDIKSPGLSSTSDMPVIETKPDVIVPKDAEEVAEVSEESTASEQPAPAADDKPKQAQGVQKRIDELTRQQEDERRRAEAAEARELRILSALEKATGARETKPQIEDKEPVKPLKSDFADPEAYDAAVENWISEKAGWIADKKVSAKFEEERRKTAEADQAAQVRQVQSSFRERVDKFRETHPDWEQVGESPDVKVSMPMSYAIVHDERGPEIQYYLGQHPEEAQRISS